MSAQKFEITGHSGEQHVVEAPNEPIARAIYADTYKEPARFAKIVEDEPDDAEDAE